MEYSVKSSSTYGLETMPPLKAQLQTLEVTLRGQAFLIKSTEH